MLVSVRVDRVTLDTTANRFVVILRDDTHHRWLPIVVGSSEAQAIALQMENIIPPRPLTHDLVKNLLDSVEVRISRVVVNDLRENTDYAMVGLKMNGTHVEVDALERLNLELQNAVTDERFEDAARLRAEINSVKKERRAEK
jgi:bifunctional DNase/RNase